MDWLSVIYLYFKMYFIVNFYTVDIKCIKIIISELNMVFTVNNCKYSVDKCSF